MQRRALLLRALGDTTLVAFVLAVFFRSGSTNHPDLILHPANLRAASLDLINEEGASCQPRIRLRRRRPALSDRRNSIMVCLPRWGAAYDIGDRFPFCPHGRRTAGYVHTPYDLDQEMVLGAHVGSLLPAGDACI